MILTGAQFKLRIEYVQLAGGNAYAKVGYQWLRIRAVTLTRRGGVRLYHSEHPVNGASFTEVRSIMPWIARTYLGWDEHLNQTEIVIELRSLRRMSMFGPDCVTPDERRLIGLKYGKLTITEVHGWDKRQRMVMCQCDCGGTKLARYSSLLRGWVKSCGCLRGKNTVLLLKAGTRYGHLTVIEKVNRPDDARKKEGHYRVRCVCGSEHIRGREAIVDRKNVHCGCGGYALLAGQRFGRLTALNHTKRDGKLRLILTRCDCGVESFARVCDLHSGKKKSCGCLKSRRLSAQMTCADRMP